MLELGFESAAEGAGDFETTIGAAAGKDPAVAARPAVIGRYRILRLIGEGGMGAVYEAEQSQPRRTVALKIIKSGMATPELLRRFEQESQALGRLQHPGIAQIYEAGTVDTGFGPQPYFAMELIRGISPREYAESHHLNTSQRLEIMVKICNAVHHAHQRGLIHRDLKPANILIDQTGQPKILDFGVARVTDSDARSTVQTDLGQLVGTLAYMSPEQVLADPLDIDTRSDVYSLGVILYEFLAGRLPYTISKKLHETIQTIREEDPIKLSVVDRGYRGDIETIAAKALEKDRTRRYASAAEMAADIQRYLKDEPIVARPPSTSYQLQKFTRRHQALVAGIAAVFFVLVAGVAASTWLAVSARRAGLAAVQSEHNAQLDRDRAEAAGRTATMARDQAMEAEGESRRDRERADLEADVARTQRLITVFQSLARESVRDSTSRVDDDRAALLARQAMLFQSRLPGQAQDLVEDALQQAAGLAPVNHNMLPGERSGFNAVAYSRDGAYLAYGGGDNTVRLWDLRNPRPLPRLLRGPNPQGTQGITAVAFSSDSVSLAVGNSSDTDVHIEVWDLRNLKATPRTFPGRTDVQSLAFSPDGAHLAAFGRSRPGVVTVWDLRNSNVSSMLLKVPDHATLATYNFTSTSVAFSPTEGTLLAAANGDSWWIWDLTNPGSVYLSFTAPTVPAGTRGALTFQSVAFSPDGAHLAVGGNGGLQVWDLRNPQAPPLRMPGMDSLNSRIDSIAYSPNGAGLAAADGSGLSVWDLRNPTGQAARLKTDSLIRAVAYSPDSARLAAASKTMQVWDTGTRGIQDGMDHFQAPIVGGHQAAYSADSRRVAVSTDGSLRVWDPSDPGTSPLLVASLQGPMRALALSPDGTRLAASDGSELLLWDLRNPSDKPVLLRRQVGRTFGRVLAFSHDGARLAALSEVENTVWVWNLRDLRTEPTLIRNLPRASSIPAYVLTFSPDGAQLAAGADRTVQVWDLRHPAVPPLKSPAEESQTPVSAKGTSLVYSPDGARLASGDGTTVRILDTKNLSVLAVLDNTGTGVQSLAFSPDGARLAASGELSRVQMWDLRKPGSAPITFSRPGFCCSSSFSADVDTIAFSGDGSRLTLRYLEGKIYSWPLWSAAADYLCTRVWRNLTMDEWRQYVGEGIPYERTCPALPAGNGAPGAPK